ncbi:hypothetical protein PTKIN_Ptkin19aG0115600 [Pterospermum kingtungense]
MEVAVQSGSQLRTEAAAAATEECSDLGNGSVAYASRSVDLTKRWVEFHPARKPFNGFKSCGSGGFRIETLNPGTSRNFRNSRQEDAHEYMVNLLESMHKCCLPSRVPSKSPSAYEKSWVHKIFGGHLCSQVKCLQCSYCSNTFGPFLDLSLKIVKADSLQKALKNFTAEELLDGGERQYQCQRCKQKVKATKQLTVCNAPHMLTIHLKRFRAHGLGQKIDKKVEFGPTLDMKPFVSVSNEGDLKYTFYGDLVHCGWSTHSGHYYYFVRTSSGMWYSL